MKPPALAKDDDSCLIAYLDTLPYLEGTPLSPIYEEGGTTEIITSSSGSYSLERELFPLIAGQQGKKKKNRRTETRSMNITQMMFCRMSSLQTLLEKRLKLKEFNDE